MMNIKLEMKIIKIHCGNTEDVHGADELYLTGVFSDGTPENTQSSIVGPPISINDDQTRHPNAVIFSATLSDDRTVRGGLYAFDEDSGKDWSKKPDWIADAKNAAVIGLSASGNPSAAGAGQVLKWGYDVLNELMSADKDDRLGGIELDVPASGPEKETRTWHFWNDGDWLGYSSWNYTVDIEITRIREPLYVAVWRPGDSGEIQAYGWTYSSFRAKYDELWDQKWRLHVLQSYVHDGQVRYNAVWRPDDSGEIQVYGWSYAAVRAKYDELWNQNWRLHILEAYVHDGQVRYNAVWRPGNSGEVQVYGWPYESFRAKYDALWDQNWRLHLLQSYVHDGQVRYNAVWRPGDSGEHQAYGVSFEDYKALYDKLWKENWRIHILQAYVHVGQVRYNAVWRPVNSAEIQVYGVTFEDYKTRYDKLWNEGWRLHTLVTY